jgi:hypothetical protein
VGHRSIERPARAPGRRNSALKVEQLGEREPDDARAVRIAGVGLDLGSRAVPQQPSTIAATSEEGRLWNRE